MAQIKIKRRHLRYLALSMIMGVFQLYRSLSDVAIPVMSEDFSSQGFVINKTTGTIANIEDQDGTVEAEQHELYIGGGSTTTNSFSQKTFATNLSTSGTQNRATAQSTDNSATHATGMAEEESSGMIYFTPIEETRQPSIAANFTRHSINLNKFASGGMLGGGESPLDVPPPPPEPTEVPLDSVSFFILLIGLGIGSYTLSKGNFREEPKGTKV